MKLEPGKNLEKNLKLLRSCSQVRIIQLTEELSKLVKTQKRIIERNPDLRRILASELNRSLALAGEPDIVNPTSEQLINIRVPGYDPEVEDQATKQYMGVYRKTAKRQQALTNFQNLTEMLSQENVSLGDVHLFMDNPENSRAFKSFVSIMKDHSPMFISLGFKHQANVLAERNDLANDQYYENAEKTFKIDSPDISLRDDLKGRFINAGKGLTIALALSAALIVSSSLLTKPDVTKMQGDLNPHTGFSQVVPQPVIAVSPEETPAIEQAGPISINKDINSYKEACEDFFQKTAEVYKYNTGEDIDLSGYGQNNISVSRNARILEVEKDGVTYRISMQSNSASNPTYLRQALDELGVSYSEYNSSLACIIDKYDDSKSIAIVDGQGNPVRSGKVLESTGSGGYMYNQQMVQAGRKILESQGKDASSLSEGACVAAYILSDSYTAQNSELSRALGETDGLANTIKTTFYSSGEKDDSYAIYLYTQDSAKFAQSFNNRVNGITQTNGTQDMEHDER